jgi:uncharacterized protein (DUF4415 family)
MSSNQNNLENNPFKAAAKRNKGGANPPANPAVQSQPVAAQEESDLISKYEKMKEIPKRSHKPTGIYFDMDIFEELERKYKEYGKGIKSDIANAAVRAYMEEKGWLS